MRHLHAHGGSLGFECSEQREVRINFSLNAINTEKLWENVVVLGVDNREVWHAQAVPTNSGSSNSNAQQTGNHPHLPTDIPTDLLPLNHPAGKLSNLTLSRF